MEVVNNNVESKGNILEYLKSINVNSSNKHEEIELDNYIASIVMIVTSSSTLNNSDEEYIIYLLFQDKKDNKIYGKFFNKEFTNKNEAENYYANLKNKVNYFTDNDIHNLI
ncbi:MAG: hypothetical protein ACI310_00480 [Bacilli bacterium]